MPRMRVDVSPGTVLKIVLTLVGLYVLWQIRAVLVIVFITLIVVAALRPVVGTLESRGWNPVVSSATVILGLVLVTSLSLYVLSAPLLEQFQSVAQGRLPQLFGHVNEWVQQRSHSPNMLVDLQRVTAWVTDQLQALTTYLLGYLSSLVDLVIAGATVLVLSFYLLAGGDDLLNKLLRLSPRHRRLRLRQAVFHVGDKLGQWMRGQVALCALMAVLTGLAGFLIGIPAYAAVGLLAGLFEIIPYLGPVMTAVVMVLMAATAEVQPLLKMVSALVAYSILQFAEGHFLVPKVMQKAIGLSPVLVILALLVGAKLGGIVGTILAVPLAAVVEAIFETWPDEVLSITRGEQPATAVTRAPPLEKPPRTPADPPGEAQASPLQAGADG